VNSIIIITEFLFNPFRDFIENTILVNDVNLGNVNYKTHNFLFRGLASGGGSSLSIAHSLAILFVIYLYFKNKLKFIYSFIFISIISVTCIFLGRTGIIISAALIFLYFFISTRKILYHYKRKISIASFFVILLFLISGIYLFDYINDEYSIIIKWAFSFDDKVGAGESFNKLISSTHILYNYKALLFGMGYYLNHHPIVQSSDSGYFKLIYSIGMPFAIMFYIYMSSSFIYFMSKINFTLLSISMIFILLVCEIKEPIFFQNYASRIFFYLFGAAFYYAQINTKIPHCKKIQI
jgi:hypothetical protein